MKTDLHKLLLSLVLPSLLVACAPPAMDTSKPTGTDRRTASAPAADENGRVFVLLRHAEKEAGTPDPALSPRGVARTAFFTEWLDRMVPPVQAIWSSDYRRTRDTAGPIAERLVLDVQIYDPRDLPALAAALESADVNAVVVGHSNTTPELAALLCQCELTSMNEDNYETGYLVSIDGGQRTITLIDFQTLWSERLVVID